MSIRVLKFGGTSLNSAYSRNLAAAHIMDARSTGDSVVVIVSAMGRMGEPYATDTFLRLLDSGKPVDGVKKDMISSCGEIITAALFSQLLESQGIRSIPLTGFQAGIITDRHFTDAGILSVNPDRILCCLNQGCVPVVAGFQGITREQEITTLGRGGSDITALVLGASLKTERVDIFTDVPGVAIVDPKIVPDAPFLEQINVRLLYELALHGSKFIHSRAVGAAIEGKIPFRIRSTFSQEKGTLVNEEAMSQEVRLVGITYQEASPKLTRITLVINPDHTERAVGELESIVKKKGRKGSGSSAKPWLYQVEAPAGSAGSIIREIFVRFYPPDKGKSPTGSAFLSRDYKYAPSTARRNNGINILK